MHEAPFTAARPGGGHLDGVVVAQHERLLPVPVHRVDIDLEGDRIDEPHVTQRDRRAALCDPQDLDPVRVVPGTERAAGCGPEWWMTVVG